MAILSDLKKELRALGTPEKTKASAWFFKTGPGQYGEGDIFLGITVPEQRTVARKYYSLELSDIEKLLASPEHEFRLTALIILVEKYDRGSLEEKKAIYELYLRNTQRINNWDLVDTSARDIVGAYLENRSIAPILTLARSRSLWERRIAIIATFHFIRRDSYEPTFKIAEILLGDSEDLIHKAVGWMLRELGKRSQKDEEVFLKKHAARMPRTMLRYAIERFPEKLRKQYLAMGKITHE